MTIIIQFPTEDVRKKSAAKKNAEVIMAILHEKLTMPIPNELEENLLDILTELYLETGYSINFSIVFPSIPLEEKYLAQLTEVVKNAAYKTMEDTAEHIKELQNKLIFSEAHRCILEWQLKNNK